MMYTLTVLPGGRQLRAGFGKKLMDALLEAGYFVESPCGGGGKCVKCVVLVDDQPVLACKTRIARDMTVTLLAP